MYRNILVAAAPLFILAGCAAPLLPKGDSLQQQKHLSFPQAGIRTEVAAGSIAAMVSDYQSRHVFQLSEPYVRKLMLGTKIAVPADERLYETEIDGRTAYCTEHLTVTDLLNNRLSQTCFYSAAQGKFSSVTFKAPAGRRYTDEVSPEIRFTSREIVGQSQAASLKRELVFEGAEGSTLLFGERIYDKSVETPARVKPLVAPVASVPRTVSLDGMDIKVIRYDAKSLTFEVIKPWQ